MAAKVSIIVPVYNVLAYMENCVRSLQVQTLTDFECILVDDGSTDGSAVECDRLAALDPRIVVIHKANGGLSDARNVGLDTASGGFVGFVDSDDTVMPDMLEVLVSRAEQNKLDVVCGDVLIHDLKTGVEQLYGPLCSFCEDDNTVTFKTVPCLLDAMFNVSAVNKLYRREVFSGRRFAKGIKFEDVPVWTDILFSGARIGCVRKPVYRYSTNRAGSIVTAHDFREYPNAWQIQFEALRDNGLFNGRLKSDFASRLALKFIQAYNLSSSATRKEFFGRTQALFREFGSVGAGHERGRLVEYAAHLHYVCCRFLPYWAYRILFSPEMLIANSRVNAFLKSHFHGRRASEV